MLRLRANCTLEQVMKLSALLTRSQAMLSSSRIFTATCSAVALQVASHTWTSQHTSVRNPLTAHGRRCMCSNQSAAQQTRGRH